MEAQDKDVVVNVITGLLFSLNKVITIDHLRNECDEEENA